MKKKILYLLVFGLIYSNFSNARGKTFQASGVYKEASEQMKSMAEAEDRWGEEEQARRRAYSNSYSSSTQDSSSKSNSVSSASKTFVCKIHCESTSGPVIYREFSGNSRREVADYVGDHADEICNSSGVSRKASHATFEESQCHEK